jgi:PKD repeat protein
MKLTCLATLFLLLSHVAFSQCNCNFSSNVNGFTVNFTDQSTSSSGTITSFSWNFGDGSQSFIANPVHVYAYPGVYTVTHSVQNTLGNCTDTIIQVIVISPAPVFPPAVSYKKTYGGPAEDIAYSIIETSDGGTLMAGHTNGVGGDVTVNKGGRDGWIVKTNKAGTIEWQKSLGGTNDDYIYAIKQVPGGGYILAGKSYSNDGDVTGHHSADTTSDCWVVKVNSSGTIEWQKSLGGSADEQGTDVLPTTDGGYIVSANTTSGDGDVTGYHSGSGNNDGWIIKLNSTGIIQWQKCIGGNNVDEVRSLLQVADGYVLAGMSQSTDGDLAGVARHNYTDYWVVKLNNTGTIQWQKCYGGSSDDIGDAICQTTDGNYVMTGLSFSNDGDVSDHHSTSSSTDIWVIKISPTGTLLWQKSFGGSMDDEGYTITATPDGGVAIAGYTFSNDGDVTMHYGTTNNADIWALKLSASGSLEWQKSFGGTLDDMASSTRQTANGGYLITGATNSTDYDVTGNHGLIDYWTIRLGTDAQQVILCPPVASTIINAGITGSSYQWQVSTDSSYYSNINAGTYYSGTTTSTLQLQNIPSSFTGYRYRCIVDGSTSGERIVRFANTWSGASNTSWSNPANWSCGAVPDQNTDVIITSGPVVVSSNVTVRSLTVTNGAVVTVGAGFKLTVLH